MGEADLADEGERGENALDTAVCVLEQPPTADAATAAVSAHMGPENARGGLFDEGIRL
jgi:hypothetical protein